jgi:hypothetical protein
VRRTTACSSLGCSRAAVVVPAHPSEGEVGVRSGSGAVTGAGFPFEGRARGGMLPRRDTWVRQRLRLQVSDAGGLKRGGGGVDEWASAASDCEREGRVTGTWPNWAGLGRSAGE